MTILLDSLDPIFADCLWKPWQGPKPRYQLDVPWVADGCAYATDGRIIVRQPARRTNTDGCFPPGKDVFEAFTPKAGIVITLPCSGQKQPDLVMCPECRGDKRTRRCPCNSGKVVRETKSIDIGCGENGIADRYLWLLRDHGIQIVQPTTCLICYSFTKGRIEGRIMGIALGAKDDG